MKRISFLFAFVLGLAFLFSACQEEIDWGNIINNGSNSGTSGYTFAGAPNACTSPALHGNYVQGTGTDSSNYIIITVNVDSIGTYTVSTGSSNGIVFSGTGSFDSTGTQTIRLQANGTPQNAGTYQFAVGTNGCSFPIAFSPSGNNNPDPACVSCDYMPYCDSMVYNYMDSTLTGNNQRNSVVRFVGDSSFDGLTWKKHYAVIDGVQGDPAFFNCTNGVVKLFTPGTTSAGGQQIPATTITFVKSNEPVGATWTDAFTTGGQSISLVTTIMEKGISRTVRGVTYSNVIHTKVETQVMGQTMITQHRYFAQGVGLIEDTQSSPMDPSYFNNSTLIDYHLP